MEDMIPINGRESSILALLAQCKDITPKEAKSCLNCLKNEESLHAYRIGCLIVGVKINHPTESEHSVAEGFKKWAQNLGKNKPRKQAY